MNYRKKNYGLLLIAMLLFISIGYALIHTTLKLSGSSKIKEARWNIYFDKVENESGVTSSETKIDSKKTTVSFDIDLEKPGDYYQFNVDTVNDGTIDAIIDSTELTGLSENTSEIIDYTVTYADGSSVNKCDTLNAKARKTLLVKVNHFKDIKEEELLDDAENLKLKFKINYVQTGACSREPILEIDPNGGKYNNTRKVTKQNVTKNTSITIPEAEREGYNFINWQTASGTDLEKDSVTHLTTVNMGTTDQKIIAQWEKAIDPAQIKHTITIDPNGGLYDNSEEIVTYQKKKNEIVEVSTNIEREGYTFTGWVLDPIDSSFVDNTLTVGLTDVTLTAGWKLNEDEVVAKIGNKYYVTLQKAFNAAVTGDKIELLKDIIEVSTNTKEVSLDLGNHTITGTINNSGNLTVDNGKIQNLTPGQTPISNTGTLTIGANDDIVSPNSIILYGKTTGLMQNGQFYFYDGYIEGDTAFKGGYNGAPTGYIVNVIWDNVLNCQKAILSLTPEGAVAKVKSYTNGVETQPLQYIYYFDLKSAIDKVISENEYNHDVYIVAQNLEASTDITVDEGQTLNINLEGNTVNYGANIVNNGTFAIKDTAQNKGTFKVSFPIVNHDTLNLNNINLQTVSNTENVIENYKDINVVNSNVSAINKYALYNKSTGTLNVDSNTYFTSTGGYAFYNDSTEEIHLNGGNFAGIHNKGKNLIVDGTTVTNPTNNNAIYNELISGTITLRNVTANTTNKYVLENKGTANIESGTYGATNTYVLDNATSAATLNIAGGTITGGGQYTVYGNGTVNISGNNTNITNTYNSNTATAVYENGVTTINGGNISATKGYAVYQYSGTLKIYGGNISNDGSTPAINIRDGNTTIEGGEITSNNNVGIKTASNGTMDILGGTIKGKTYGVHVNYSSAKVNIGSNDDNVDPDLPERKPVIIGETYGLYKSSGTVGFYDGIIEGKNNAVYYGKINEVADGTEIVKDTDTIDNEQYYTVYLYVQDDFLQVYGGGTYNSLKKAVGAITGTGKIIVYRDGKVSSTSTIPSSKNITLDLHGNKITATVPITNEGTLTIIDDGEVSENGKTGKIENTVSNVIENKKTLVIDDGIFESTSGDIIRQDTSNTNTTINGGTFNSKSGNSNYVVYISYGNIDIEGGTFDSKAFYTLYINSGTNTIKNATVKNSYSSGYAINTSGTTTIDNVTITDSKNGIKNYHKLYLMNTEIDVDGIGIDSTDGGSSYNYPNIDYSNTNITSGGVGIDADDTVLVVNSGTITSDTDAIYNSECSVTVYGGTIYGKNRGIYNFTRNSAYSATTNIGDNTDATVADITKPIIIGDNYGVYANSVVNNRINFYDGIIKSKGTQVDPFITTTPDGYITEDGVDSLDSSYKTTYLVTQQPFIQVGDDPTNVFSSLQQAITAAGTNGSMKLVANGSNTSTATVTATQDIKLDLNGYTITTTKKIINNGTLTINNDGTINTINNATTFDNYGTLTINDGNYYVDKGKFILIETGGTFNLNGGSITGTSNTIIDNSGSFNMTGGTIDYTGGSGTNPISSGQGNINMSGGTIGSTTAKVSSVISMSYYPTTLEISGSASILTKEGKCISISGSSSSGNKKPTFNMYGGNLYSSDSYVIDTSYGAIVTIYDGTIKSDKSIALNIGTSGNVTIYGGELIGKTYGAYLTSGTLTLGTNNSEIKLEPVIKGDTYGVYNKNGTFKFYDGVLKGKNSSVYYGNITATADNTELGDGTEVDPDTGDTYYTKYLVSQQAFVMNTTKAGNPTYSNLQLAITEADSDDELELYGNGTIYNSITIPDKTLKLDLNNFNISISGPITNNGTLTIIDENTSGTKGKISTVGSFDLITNNKSLTVDNVSLENEYGNNYIINNASSSTLTLSGANINGKYGINNNLGSTLTSTNSSINATSMYAITNSGGDIDVTGGTISNSDTTSSLYYTMSLGNNSSTGTVTLRNVTVSRTKYYYDAISNTRDDLKLYNVNVTGIIKNNSQNSKLLYDGGTINGAILNSGDLEVNNITLTARQNYGISNIANNSKLVKVSNSNITVTRALEEDDGIRNNGNIKITNTNITLTEATNSAGIRNYGSGEFTVIGGNISVSASSSTNFGIRNDTTSTVNNKISPNSITVSGGNNAYGILNRNGTLTLLSGRVDVSNATNAYGIYLYGGEVILGTYDGSGDPSADVSTTTPLLKGVGTTGYGAYRTDGTFRFFDGKIIGSTNAKNFAPAQIEDNFIVRTITELTTGYEYAILECLTQQGATDIDWSVKVSDDDIIKQRVFSVDNIVWVDGNNNPVGQLQYGALGNIKIKVDGNGMSGDFNYRIVVTLADGSPIEVTNNNIVETMTISSDPEDNKKDFTIALNCASPTADYTTIDKDVLVTITIEKIN